MKYGTRQRPSLPIIYYVSQGLTREGKDKANRPRHRVAAEELASANDPRYYQPTSDTQMTLTIKALGLYEVPIISSANLEVLDKGLMHEPETSLPWDSGAQRNVFIAGH